jgi:hypothetical protein
MNPFRSSRQWVVGVVLFWLAGQGGTQARPIPTPLYAIQFSYAGDPRDLQWDLGHEAASPEGFLVELIPAGSGPIAEWKELIVIQTLFGNFPLPTYVDAFMAGLQQADPNIQASRKPGPENTEVVVYESRSAREKSVRRFFAAGDGIYMIAYNCRPGAVSDEIFSHWEMILNKAKLVPNPGR